MVAGGVPTPETSTRFSTDETRALVELQRGLPVVRALPGEEEQAKAILATHTDKGRASVKPVVQRGAQWCNVAPWLK